MTFPGRLAKRLSCPVAVLLAVGAFALVFMPVVSYQPSCPGSGTVEGPLSEAFVLAVSDQLTLRGMTFAVYRTTYKDKTYGDREDVPEHWREHRTWNIYTTIWHAWAGTWLPTAQRRAPEGEVTAGRATIFRPQWSAFMAAITGRRWRRYFF